MSTVLVGKPGKGGDTISRDAKLSDIEAKGTLVIEKEVKDEVTAPPLGEPHEEKRWWFQRDKTFNPEATATLVR
jgi:hypothetical protein